MPVQNGYGAPTLDFTVCALGRFCLIETKAPGKKLTPRQELVKNEAEQAGAKVIVIGEAWLDENLKDFYNCAYQYTGEAELEVWLLGLTRQQ